MQSGLTLVPWGGRIIYTLVDLSCALCIRQMFSIGKICLNLEFKEQME